MSQRARTWSVLIISLIIIAPAKGQGVRDGAKPQWTREFFGAESGLPAESANQIVLGEDAQPWLFAGGKTLVRQNGRWEPAWLSVELDGAVNDGPEAGAKSAWGSGRVWRVHGGEAHPDAGAPVGVGFLVSVPGEDVWAVVNHGENKGVWAREKGGKGWKKLFELDSNGGEVRSLCRLESGVVFAVSETGVSKMSPDKGWTRINAVPGGLLSDRVSQVLGLGADHAMLLTSRGLSVTDGAKGWLDFSGKEGLPIEALTSAATSADSVWFGTEQGVVLWRQGKFTYFAGPRWLPDDRVTAIAAEKNGVWVATRGGVAHLFQKPMSLAQKADFYQKLTESRPRRLGFVTVMYSAVPGDFTQAEQEISDNDGLWTAMYVAAESFRFAVTHDDKARQQARKSMIALLRLESITGISGFPARAISDTRDPAHARRSGGQWHDSPVEKGWMWKGDTSSDEIVGHFLAFYVYSTLVADEAEKREIRTTCKRIIDHILNHGYYLVDITGKPTTWGYWSPQALNTVPPHGDTGLNSLEILSHLKVAIALLGEDRYKAAYRELIENHHYALNTVRQRSGSASSANHSDDELAFLSYYPLLILETDPALKAIYQASIRRTWNAVRPEQCPPWNFIFGACTQEACDAGLAVDALYEIPLDLTHWPTANARRADLRQDPAVDRFARRQLVRPLSWTERPLHKWNGNPYDIDGGNASEEEDPTFWLLPYWMGRYYHFIE